MTGMRKDIARILIQKILRRLESTQASHCKIKQCALFRGIELTFKLYYNAFK